MGNFKLNKKTGIVTLTNYKEFMPEEFKNYLSSNNVKDYSFAWWYHLEYGYQYHVWTKFEDSGEISDYSYELAMIVLEALKETEIYKDTHF